MSGLAWQDPLKEARERFEEVCFDEPSKREPVECATWIERVYERPHGWGYVAFCCCRGHCATDAISVWQPTAYQAELVAALHVTGSAA